MAQVDRDKGIVDLVKIMDDVFSFVKEAEPMKKIESHFRIIELMIRQTTECAYFIRDYAMNKGFCKLTCTLHVRVSHCFVHCQGNEHSKIVSCRMSIVIFNDIRTS